MIFLNINELIAAFTQHQFAQHQIKGKRIKKELAILQEYHSQKLTFKKYQLSPYGISFYLETQYEHKMFSFEVFIDSEYPFNPPKVFYESENSQYANGQDLLDNLLEGGTWGPSLLLNSIFDKLEILPKSIFQENENLVTRYHVNQIYQEAILSRYKVQLFKVDEFTWKYMIKSTTKKVIGLTKETFLKFTSEGEKLRLESYIRIKDIKEANASLNSGKFKLDIVTAEQTGKNKYYFGGDEADLQKILYYMNPIQVIERKLSKHKQNYKAQELQQAIKEYSDLIEHYSLRDPQKTKTYVNMVQKLIKNNYQQEMKPQQKMQKMAEDIKT